MVPFRRHVAVALDGGGLKGVMVARALSLLEDHLGSPLASRVTLSAGTSTGAILAAGIAGGKTGEELLELYRTLGKTVFRKTFRSSVWPLSRYRYEPKPLEAAVRDHIGDGTLGSFWNRERQTDVVITTFDLVENRTRFLKSWKPEYQAWPLVKAIVSSCSVPTCFPPVDGRFVDGGVGSYSNPCYLAAYELMYCLGWDPAETTLLSIGTGRDPAFVRQNEASGWMAWDWIQPMLGAFFRSADDQQVEIVDTFFRSLDFRRFQIDLEKMIPMDDPSFIPELEKLGEKLGLKIINDENDHVIGMSKPRMSTVS